MSLLVLAVVSIVAFAAMRLSMNIIFRMLDKFKRKPEHQRIIRMSMFIISPLIWVAIFIYPVSYGGVPRDFNLWVMYWSMKTIGYFMAPAFVAFVVAMVLENR